MVGPRRRAFLLGCDSAGLEHCATDAERMCEVLTLRGFSVEQCLTSSRLMDWCGATGSGADGPPPRTPVGIVEELLRGFLGASRQGDTVLVYFSGHSLFDEKVFNLVVGVDQNDTGHLLNVASIAGLLKQHRKPAERLLVLDCCEAETAASEDFWEGVAGDWLRIWVAARTNENAQELDGSTSGGLFTASILRALDDEAPQLADKQGCLRIAAVDAFVRERAAGYRSPSGKPAPCSGLHGSTSHDILLAEGLEPPLAVTGWPRELLAPLHAALQQLGIGEALAGESYAYCRARADSAILPCLSEDTSSERLIEILCDPARYYFAGNRLKLPLLSFVAYLSRALQHPDRLDRWLLDAKQWLTESGGVAPAHVDEAGQVSDRSPRAEPQPYLMIRVDPDLTGKPGSYNLSWHYIDEYGEPVGQRDPSARITSHQDLIAEILTAVRALPGRPPRKPQVELLLPFLLLRDEGFIDALERAYYRDGKRPSTARLGLGDLAADFPLVLRCWERWFEPLLVNDRGGANAKGLWRANGARCLAQAPTPPCLHWLKPGAGQSLDAAAHGRLRPQPPSQGALALGYDQPIPSKDLAALLDLGVPVLLWPRHQTPAKTILKALKTNLTRGQSEPALACLPSALHDHRLREIARNRASPCDFSLLWEDPNRPGLDLPDHDSSTMYRDAK